jgi:hypothetical protein
MAFLEGREGCLFTAAVRRSLPRVAMTDESQKKVPGNYSRPSRKILKSPPGNWRAVWAWGTGGEKQIAAFNALGKMRRIGPDRGGHLEVVKQ